jgi:nucleoside-diphosphate-sugar epimerase
MQNLTGDLFHDIRDRNRIELPAGKACFNWVDAKDVGEMAAFLLQHFDSYKNAVFEVTSEEQKNFQEVTELLTEELGRPIHYRSPDPFSFYRRKRKEGNPKGKILVMLMLHLLPRFQSAPPLSRGYQDLMGKRPGSLKVFIQRNLELFCP